jgi:hypothetical protein
MGEHIHYQVLKAPKVAILGASFFSNSCDEVTFIDNQQWLLIHVYVLDNWVHTSLLLSMAQVIDGLYAKKYVVTLALTPKFLERDCRCQNPSV